jgi:predicted acylesterase/phospholipase RssA
MLDADAVEFMRATPTIDLARLGDQAARPGQSLPETEVMVAVSGGGARAAAFALGVLAEMETLGSWTVAPGGGNPLNEIDYFSSVSGGGWGAAAYLADRHFAGEGHAYRIWDRVPAIRQTLLETGSYRGKCLPERLDGLTRRKGQPLLLDHVLGTPAGQAPTLPYLFVNASLQTDQHPFVFSPEFARHYQVKRWEFCDRTVTPAVPGGVEGVEVSEAMAVSGSVPGFYHSRASSALCDDPTSRMWGSFYCSNGKGGYNTLVLVDGGLFDNYGYYTALEVLRQTPRARKRVLLVIDANADTEIPFARAGTKSNTRLAISSGLMLGFPARTAVYQRNIRSMTEMLGIDLVQLDFAVAAGLRDTVLANGRNAMEGLPTLREQGQRFVNCFDDDGKFLIAARGETSWRFADCRENNYYRSGLLNKTTYYIDHWWFNVLFELGRLVVRLKADEIHAALYGASSSSGANR